MLTSSVAVAVLLLAEGFPAVAEALGEVSGVVFPRKCVWILGDDLIDGLGAVHVIIFILAGLAETGLHEESIT